MAAKQVGPSAVLPRCELLTALLKVAVNLDGPPLLVNEPAVGCVPERNPGTDGPT
jgi:hypothetical protein